jgi:hypothetical protein
MGIANRRALAVACLAQPNLGGETLRRITATKCRLVANFKANAVGSTLPALLIFDDDFKTTFEFLPQIMDEYRGSRRTEANGTVCVMVAKPGPQSAFGPLRRFATTFFAERAR